MPLARFAGSRLALATFGAGAVALGGCGSSTSTNTAAPDTTLRGAIVVDGSSTVAPLSQAVSDAFVAAHTLVSAQVRTSGTGGGFKALCGRRADVSGASRRINANEAAACEASGVSPVELQVATDGITVVTRKGATSGATCLTLGQLKAIWESSSKVARWSDVDSAFADSLMFLAGPGKDSGTYDFFNEAVLGKGADGEVLPPRGDYLSSEDDNVLVRAIEAEPAGLGYFGYSYFAKNAEQLSAIMLDGRGPLGCLAPTPQTIIGGTYPLARPLFVYVSRDSLKREVVRRFTRFYLDRATGLGRTASILAAPRFALSRSSSALERTIAELDNASS